MRSMILMGCLCMLSAAANAQINGRVRSGTPLRWAMNGSVEIMEGDLTKHYGSTDSATNKIIRNTSVKAPVGNPHATRISSIQTQCDNNSMLLKWVAVQQYNIDKYEVEQSADGGRNWTVAGVVPAQQYEFGEASYSFNYYKDVSNVLFRIAAVSIGGERLMSATFDSPCSNSSYFGATPNPVYSTTTVRIGSPAASKVKMFLVDAKGSVVHSTNESLMRGMNNVSIDMSRLQRGYYTLAVQWMNGKQETLNLVKY